MCDNNIAKVVLTHTASKTSDKGKSVKLFWKLLSKKLFYVAITNVCHAFRLYKPGISAFGMHLRVIP